MLSDPEEALKQVRKSYRERFDVRWLSPFGFNNSYTITVRREDALQNRWRTISDLAEAASGLRAGFTAEFAERPDGYPGLRKAYNFYFGEIMDLDPAILYQAIANGEVDVICAFATDGRIPANDLKPLTDDRLFFPPYEAAPVIRNACLTAYPEVGEALSLLAGRLDNRTMQDLNFEVDEKRKSPAEVAREFLEKKGLM